MGGKLRAVESIIDDMSSGELTGRPAPGSGEGEISMAPVESVLQRIAGAKQTPEGKTQLQEHTNPVMLQDLAKKFRDAGAFLVVGSWAIARAQDTPPAADNKRVNR